jgi:hypothetical protein
VTPLNDEDLKKLERVLAEAHRGRPEPALDEAWRQGIMRAVRRRAADPSALPVSLIERLVWRTAAVAAALAVLVATSVLSPSSDTAVHTALVMEDVEAPLIE